MKITHTIPPPQIDWTRVKNGDVLKDGEGRIYVVADNNPAASKQVNAVHFMDGVPDDESDTYLKARFIAHYPDAELVLGSPA